VQRVQLCPPFSVEASKCRFAEQRIDGVALDEHLDGVAIDRQARDLGRQLGVADVVDEEPAVSIEVEEPRPRQAIDVRLLHRAGAPGRRRRGRGRRLQSGCARGVGGARAAQARAAAGVARREFGLARLTIF